MTGSARVQGRACWPSRPPNRIGVLPPGPSSPGEMVGGFLEQEIVTAGELRLSRAKFAEEANAAQWQAIAQQFRVLNGVRIEFFEVLACHAHLAGPHRSSPDAELIRYVA